MEAWALLASRNSLLLFSLLLDFLGHPGSLRLPLSGVQSEGEGVHGDVEGEWQASVSQ